MKIKMIFAAMLLIAGVSVAATAQTRANARPGGSRDECTITAFANDIVRIEMVRLANGFYSHKAYGEKNEFICDGEWSVTYELNKEAAEILRFKGNNRATIVDRVGGRS